MSEGVSGAGGKTADVFGIAGCGEGGGVEVAQVLEVVPVVPHFCQGKVLSLQQFHHAPSWNFCHKKPKL